MLPCPGNCKEYSSEHLNNMSFRIVAFSEYMSSNWVAESHGSLIPSFFEESSHCSPKSLYQFEIPPTVQEGSFSSKSSPGFIVSRF